MNTATRRRGAYILIVACALIVAPGMWRTAAGLNWSGSTGTLIGKASVFATHALIAWAVFRVRWLQIVLGAIAAMFALLGVMSGFSVVSLAMTGHLAFLEHTPLSGHFAITGAAAFVAWAFLLSDAVRERARPQASAA